MRSAERSPTSNIPKKVAPALSRIFSSEEALFKEMSKAPVWFQSAVRGPSSILSALAVIPLPPTTLKVLSAERSPPPVSPAPAVSSLVVKTYDPEA